VFGINKKGKPVDDGKTSLQWAMDRIEGLTPDEIRELCRNYHLLTLEYRSKWHSLQRVVDTFDAMEAAANPKSAVEDMLSML
jgi:hypothetical protein